MFYSLTANLHQKHAGQKSSGFMISEPIKISPSKQILSNEKTLMNSSNATTLKTVMKENPPGPKRIRTDAGGHLITKILST